MKHGYSKRFQGKIKLHGTICRQNEWESNCEQYHGTDECNC